MGMHYLPYAMITFGTAEEAALTIALTEQAENTQVDKDGIEALMPEPWRDDAWEH